MNETKESIPLDHFSQFLQSIHPENCIIERCSRSAWEEAQQNGEEETADGNIFGFQNEQWYGVQYHLCRIPPSDVLDWKKGGDVTSTKNLHLPTENVFIPRDLSLCADLPEDAMNGPRISKEMDPPLLIVTNEFGMSCMFTHICYTFTTRLVIQTCS